jgi:hypothetical protein
MFGRVVGSRENEADECRQAYSDRRSCAAAVSQQRLQQSSVSRIALRKRTLTAVKMQLDYLS